MSGEGEAQQQQIQMSAEDLKMMEELQETLRARLQSNEKRPLLMENGGGRMEEGGYRPVIRSVNDVVMMKGLHPP
eukprot:11819829-Ditylum_brightwellii.AAC.1